VTVVYVGHAPDEEAPGIVVTDDPCPDCGWPETTIRVYAEDNSVAKCCASCDRIEWIDPAIHTSHNLETK
jgi:hypothetical protein